MENELKFSLKLEELPISIMTADGQEKKYVLRELTGLQRDTYLDEMGKRMKMVIGEDGKTKGEGLTDYVGIQSSLLSKCLYDENDDLIKEDVLQTYPATVLGDLFKAAQDLSQLGKLEEEEGTEVKNE